MKIACTSNEGAEQVLEVLARHGITRGVSWPEPVAGTKTVRIVVHAAIDPAKAPTIRRDIEAIDAATIED